MAAWRWRTTPAANEGTQADPNRFQSAIIDLGRQGMLSFVLPPPIPYGLFKKNSRLPSAASAY